MDGASRNTVLPFPACIPTQAVPRTLKTPGILLALSDLYLDTCHSHRGGFWICF